MFLKKKFSRNLSVSLVVRDLWNAKLPSNFAGNRFSKNCSEPQKGVSHGTACHWFLFSLTNFYDFRELCFSKEV